MTSMPDDCYPDNVLVTGYCKHADGKRDMRLSFALKAATLAKKNFNALFDLEMKTLRLALWQARTYG